MELRQVSELHLADTAVGIKQLKPLLEVGNLEVLNLSDRQVDPELLKVLAAAGSLRHLILHNSNIDAASLERARTATRATPTDYTWADVAVAALRRAPDIAQRIGTHAHGGPVFDDGDWIGIPGPRAEGISENDQQEAGAS